VDAAVALFTHIGIALAPHDAFVTAAWWGNLDVLHEMNVLGVQPMLLDEDGKQILAGVMVARRMEVCA
jgi:hypothetical protein